MFFGATPDLLRHEIDPLFPPAGGEPFHMDLSLPNSFPTTDRLRLSLFFSPAPLIERMATLVPSPLETLG